MRVGTILEDTEKDKYGHGFEPGKGRRFLVFTGMVKGMANLLCQRDKGMDNAPCRLSDIGAGKRFVPVGYCNLFGGEPLSSALAKIGDNTHSETKGTVSIPSQVGDEVWRVESDSKKIVRGTVEGYSWSKSCGFALNIMWDEKVDVGGFVVRRQAVPFSKVGETVFLTYEEAQNVVRHYGGLKAWK